MSPDSPLSNGEQTPAPESLVEDDVWLYRLIPAGLCERVQDGWEFRSGAFANSTEPGYEITMSVVLDDCLSLHERVPEDLPGLSFPDEPGQWGVAKLLTRTVREIPEQEIIRSPTDDEPAHGDVMGVKNSKRRKRFKKSATWVIEPAAPSDPVD